MSGTPFAPDAEMKNAYEYFLRSFKPVVFLLLRICTEKYHHRKIGPALPFTNSQLLFIGTLKRSMVCFFYPGVRLYARSPAEFPVNPQLSEHYT